MDDRPRATNGATATTRGACAVSALFGGTRHGDVVLTEDEMGSLRQLYGVTSAGHPLLRAGATRNLFRHAERDGLRVVAVLARWLEPRADPVRLVQELLAGAGFDAQLDDKEEVPHD